MRRIGALELGMCVVLGFVTYGGYQIGRQIGQIRTIHRMQREAFSTQVDVLSTSQAAADLECGHRGYLITRDSSFSNTYDDAKVKLTADLGRLRTAFANGTDEDRSVERRLEILLSSNAPETERAIALRQHGYKQRAFALMASNDAMKDMDTARALLSSLATRQGARLATLDQQRGAVITEALTWTIGTAVFLLTSALFLFGLVRRRQTLLDHESARRTMELSELETELEKIASTLSNERRRLSLIQSNAQLLLQNYGGFLPTSGHEITEQIIEAASQEDRLRLETNVQVDEARVDSQYERVA